MKRSSFSRAAVIDRAKAIYQRTGKTWGAALAAAYRMEYADQCFLRPLTRKQTQPPITSRSRVPISAG